MRYFDVEQPSPEWANLRLGRPTASEFHRIMTAVGRKPSRGIDRLIDQLLGEKLSVHFPERIENYTERWGKETEPQARDWYRLETRLDVRKGGFITTDDYRFGASPDALIYKDGRWVRGLEIKCPSDPANHMSYLRSGVLPPKYMAQVHGGLICGAPEIVEWDFLSYHAGCEPFLIRVVPDDFTARLAECLEVFYARYIEAAEKAQDPLGRLKPMIEAYRTNGHFFEESVPCGR